MRLRRPYVPPPDCPACGEQCGRDPETCQAVIDIAAQRARLRAAAGLPPRQEN